MEYKTIVMMGKPGSGKGVQSKLFAEETGFKVFSTGARLREMAKQDTSVGKKVKEVIESGALMPYWFASLLFQEAIISITHDQGIIYEGACRKRPEAELFHDVMTWLDRPYKAIYINADDKVIVERLSKRKEAEGRADDSEEKIKVRLAAHYNEVVHAIKFFKETGNMIEINGNNTVSEVHKEILEKFKQV